MNDNGDTPLLLAVKNKNLTATRMLIEKGALVSSTDKVGHIILSTAGCTNWLQVHYDLRDVRTNSMRFFSQLQHILFCTYDLTAFYRPFRWPSR